MNTSGKFLLGAIAALVIYKISQGKTLAENLQTTWRIHKFTLQGATPVMILAMETTNPTNAAISILSISGRLIYAGGEIGNFADITKTDILPQSKNEFMIPVKFNIGNIFLLILKNIQNLKKSFTVEYRIQTPAAAYNDKITLIA